MLTQADRSIDGGKIVYERYFNGGQDSDQFISWSMAKSITSILFGIALAEGHIGSLSDTVETYLPDLVGSAYEGVTIEQMLLMRAGTDYSEVEDLDVAKDRSMYRNQMTFSDVSGLGIKRINEPGSIMGDWQTGQLILLA